MSVEFGAGGLSPAPLIISSFRQCMHGMGPMHAPAIYYVYQYTVVYIGWG